MLGIGSGSHLLFGLHRREIPRSLLHPPDFPKELGKVFFAFNKIDFTGIDDQKRGLVIVEKKVIVGFCQPLQVV